MHLETPKHLSVCKNACVYSLVTQHKHVQSDDREKRGILLQAGWDCWMSECKQ